LPFLEIEMLRHNPTSVSLILFYQVQVTIEKFWARSGQEMGKKRARTFTNFDRGPVDFWHMGVQVSRIKTEVYGESSENLIFYSESVLETNDSDRMAMGAATTMMVAAGSLSGQW
jgi:hypothetical protein